MKYSTLFALLSAVLVFARGADAPSTATVQTGRLSTVHLLKTGRAPGKAAPDGMAFLFLVTRTPEARGQFTLKETKDFLVAGESYQEKTQAALGQKFEPGTMIDSAEKFFTKNTGLRRLVPADLDLKNAMILSVVIGGAKLPVDVEHADVTVHVGYEKEVEPFSFRVQVPAARQAPLPKS